MAAILDPSQLRVSNSSHAPLTHARPATSFSASSIFATVPPPGARITVASALIPIRMKAVSALADSSPPLFRNDGTGIVANVPRRLNPTSLAGTSGRFTKMEGGLFQGEAANSRGSLLAVKQTKVVIMVDPVEAKRLAAAEMKAIQARAKLKRRKEVEAINGGWALIGLTAGVVIDGYTGKSILTQVAGYIDAVADFLAPLIPS